MKTLIALCVVLGIAACGPPNPNSPPAGRSDTRQIPSNTTPGIHISGHVNVGVKKRF